MDRTEFQAGTGGFRLRALVAWTATYLLVLGYLLFCAVARCQVPIQLPAQPPALPSDSGPAVSERSPHAIRTQNFLAGRQTASGSHYLPRTIPARAALINRASANAAAGFAATWTAVGPTQIGSLAYGDVTGRITSIAIDPADSTGNTVYLGTTGGGVWKSFNAAGPVASVRFLPLTDTLPAFSPGTGSAAVPSLSIGAVSVGDGIVLAGTGDPNDALDSYYGSGLLRSADGGTTWSLVQQSNDGTNGHHSFTGLGFAGFAWNSAAPGVASSVAPTTVVAAVADAAEGLLVNATDNLNSVRGLYYSTDSGLTWQMAVVHDGSQTVQSPLLFGLNMGGNAATSVVWNPVRQRFYAAIRFHGYYESVDGRVWTRLASQPGRGLTLAACPTSPGTTGSVGCPIFRGALAVEPVTGDTYAFTTDAQNFDQGIWRDICQSNGSTCASSEATFALPINTAPLEQGGNTYIPQADYDLSLAAVASGSQTLLFAGTIDLYRCAFDSARTDAAACSFRNTTNTLNGCAAPAMVAPAQHAIATVSPALLLLGNDGGLWRSTDGAEEQGNPCSADDANHFQNLNAGLGSLAEVVSFAQHPSDPKTLLVGVGENGTAATSAAAVQPGWPQLAPGEGGFAAIDPLAPANWYASTAAGVSITHCGDGNACGAADFVGLPTVGPVQTAYDASLIDAPWILDPALTANVLIGTCRVWRGPAADGDAWSSANILSSNLGGPQNASCTSDNPVIRSLAAGGPVSSLAAGANAGSEVVYAGMAGALDGGGTLGGHIFTTHAANTAQSSTAWTDVALSPVLNDPSNIGLFNPTGFDISAIFVDPHDATGGTVYATVMGFGGNNYQVPHVYRSVDAAAHWTNISSNLPDAPANSIVVDPNDANTVYVAFDTGVYATSSVASCASTDCWSVFGAGLPNAPVVELAAAPAMPVGTGTAVSELRAATYGRGIWQIPLLTAAAPVQAAIAFAPASLSFTSLATGSASASQTITITSSGSAPLSITGVVSTGDFLVTSNCAGMTLAIRASCSAQVAFHPSAAGARSGVLTVYGNVTGGQAVATLSGVGAAPAAVALDPLALDFGTITSGLTSGTQNVTVSNSGGVDASVQTPAIAGDFHIAANTCGATLAPGVSCTIAVTFSPTAGGTRDGRLTVANSTGTQTTSLTGVGATPATDTLSPLSLNFGSQLAGGASATQRVTLVNSGDDTLTAVAAQITAGDFTVVSSCGTALAGHATCVLQVAFVPTRAGAASGTLTVYDQLRTQTVTLAGIGLSPPLLAVAPSALSFAATLIGQTTAAQPIAVSNAGNGSLAITGVVATGNFVESNTCVGKVLTLNATCFVKVTFLPASSGPLTGTLTVTSNAPNGGATQQVAVALGGTGSFPAEIVLDPVALSFDNVTLGLSSAAENVTISNTGGVAATLTSISVAGGDFKVSANTCGAALAPSSGCTVAIIFTPTASGTRTGMLTVVDSVGKQTATLTGGGASVATDGLAPLSLAFAPQQVGTIGASQQVTLTNTGDNALTLITFKISGDFVATGCGPVLAGHSACAISVASAPKSVGPGMGVLTVSDEFKTQMVTLSGTGLAPPGVSLTPLAGLTFAALGIGQSSPPQTITLSNQGGVALALGSIAATGDFAVPSATNTCGASVAAAGACSFEVVFSPTVGGARSGSISITDDAASSPQALVLTGTGIDFTLTANGATSVTITNGQSAVYPLLLRSAAGLPGTVALTCTGIPANSTCNVTPLSSPLGQTVTISLTVESGVTSAAADVVPRSTSRAVWWAIALPMLFFRRRRLASRLSSLLLISFSLLAGSGCGAGRLIPPSDLGGGSGTGGGVITTSGTYAITASATSAGLVRTVALTLVVE